MKRGQTGVARPNGHKRAATPMIREMMSTAERLLLIDSFVKAIECMMAEKIAVPQDTMDLYHFIIANWNGDN